MGTRGHLCSVDSVFHLYVGSGVQAQALSLHHRHFYLLNELRGRLISDMVSPLPQPEDDSTVTPAALPSPATLFSRSVGKMRCAVSVLAPQSKTRMSSSGKAASQEPSALCWAILPTGHGPTLSSISAVSRICATLLPHSDPPAFPS